MDHNTTLQTHCDLDIILPCYNPDKDFMGALVAMFNGLEAAYPDKRLHLIVSDDGSVRNFGPEVQSALRSAIPDVEITGYEQNAGKGAALRAGMAVSRAPHVIYTDVDIPFSLESVESVIDRVFEGWDVVMARRGNEYMRMLAPCRKLFSFGSRFLNRMALGLKHADTQGGLKGLSSRAREIMLSTRINGFLFDTEFVRLASKAKDITMVSVDVRLRDGIALSKMPVRMAFGQLRDFFKIVSRR